MKKSRPYLSLDERLKGLFGEKIQKIPLDANSSCPNRDGTISFGGCSFCNEKGAGPGRISGSLEHQWNWWIKRYASSRRLRNVRRYLGYLQSFSNTYGSSARLRSLICELSALPGIAGACIGTRPDCIDKEKIQILSENPWKEFWLEFGVQSFRADTLKRIRRGHTPEDAEQAIVLAAEAGLNVCIHLMAGLPGEDMEDFLRSVRHASLLPIAGIKFHNVYVPSGSALALEWKAGNYVPPNFDEYAEAAAEAVRLLRPDIVIHRLASEPNREDLIAPGWASDKSSVISRIERILEYGGYRQGDLFSRP